MKNNEPETHPIIQKKSLKEQEAIIQSYLKNKKITFHCTECGYHFPIQQKMQKVSCPKCRATFRRNFKKKVGIKRNEKTQ
ncbi:hypothetical protein HB838_11265 [Listeria seeligeri]|uniref:hypothetical protein n=1 Tax=Listeria seeligeri TaxID=1640 RepID=UPI0016267DC8|nr:hypothetical protein [Listeria seeligeri]MBC2031106.1 hypothetical protein [Listeria seeligeri]MBC6115431.1 hypothetical protein [Listeria seeligeri]